MVVTEERYKIAAEIERIAKAYSVPREDLMGLVGMSFDAGQKDGLTAFAINLTSEVNGDPAGVTH
jgi:hypothetical protein